MKEKLNGILVFSFLFFLKKRSVKKERKGSPLLSSLPRRSDPHLNQIPPAADTDEDSTDPVAGAAVLSISLSLTSVLHPSKSNALTAPPPTSLRIPTQLSSLTRLFLHPTPAASELGSATRRSSLAAVPLQSLLLGRPRPSPDPSHPFALRRASIVWFRNDLRVQDHEALDAAHRDSLFLLPVYCFDSRDSGKSSAGFDKTGPSRASFLLQSVADLRKSLRARGSDLVVHVGRAEAVLAEMTKAVGAEAVYAHREVSHDEVRAEERVEMAMEEEGVEVKYFWGSTLYHIDDLPFKLEDMPSNYGGFRERVQRLSVRKAIKALDQLKKLPVRGVVEVGEIPTLVDLGISSTPTLPQGGKPGAHASLIGGETEALQRFQKFASECRSQPNKVENGQDNIYGANFSCKISPWLAMGCLSPRMMFEELKKSANRPFSVASSMKNAVGTPKAGGGMNWLMFELLWRDFFRFITKKYSCRKKIDRTRATSCAGALA